MLDLDSMRVCVCVYAVEHLWVSARAQPLCERWVSINVFVWTVFVCRIDIWAHVSTLDDVAGYLCLPVYFARAHTFSRKRELDLLLVFCERLIFYYAVTVQIFCLVCGWRIIRFINHRALAKRPGLEERDENRRNFIQINISRKLSILKNKYHDDDDVHEIESDWFRTFRCKILTFVDICEPDKYRIENFNCSSFVYLINLESRRITCQFSCANK